MFSCLYNYGLSLLYKNPPSTTLSREIATTIARPNINGVDIAMGAMVIDGVYIGSIMTATDSTWLRAHCIGAVVDAGGFPYIKTVSTTSVAIDDCNVTLDLIDRYMEVFKRCARVVAREHAEGRNVLVHCAVGMNRSAAIIGFYLADMGYQYDDIIALLTRANRTRGIPVLTNITFRYLLRTYCACRSTAGLCPLSR